MNRVIGSIERFWRVAGVVLVLICALAVVTEDRAALSADRALLVGVAGKPNPKQKPLQGVKNDVTLFEKTLIAVRLFEPQQIKTLLNENATYAGVVGNFKKWLIQGSSNGDTVLFYFSGHGCQVWDEDGDEEDGKDEALCCWDSQILKKKVRRRVGGVWAEAHELAFTRNLLLDDEIRELLKQLHGRRVIFMSDSCHSGTVYKGIDPFFVQFKTLDEPSGYKSVFDDRTSAFLEQVPARKPLAIVDKPEIPGVELAAFNACQDHQLSREFPFPVEPKGWHGIFTWCLVRQLAGGAKKRGDWAITLGGLAEFIKQGVEELKKMHPKVFAQIPQAVFSPKSLADQPLIRRQAAATLPPTTAVPPTQPAGGWGQPPKPEATPAQPTITRPTVLACFIEKGPGVTASEMEKLKSKVQRSVLGVKWTNRTDQVSCKVVLEKVAGTYGARISDASGDYWETNKGTDLEEVASGLSANIRAYFIQNFLAALRNPSGRRDVDINVTVKGPKPRSQGEAVQGDAVMFEAETKTGGYPYVFSVDTLGVIHPLFPVPNTEVRQIQPGTRGLLGSENSFVVAEPFGKEMVFAVMLDRPLSSLFSLWAQDHVGDSKQESFGPQQLFLDTLWSELIDSGKPKGDWTSQSRVIRSFRQ